MISIGANNHKIAYGIRHYNLDVEADFAELDTWGLPAGCTAFVIETSKHYMLNSQSEWIEITPFGSGSSSSGGSSGGGGDTPGGDNNPDNPDDPTLDDVIYDGGVI